MSYLSSLSVVWVVSVQGNGTLATRWSVCMFRVTSLSVMTLVVLSLLPLRCCEEGVTCLMLAAQGGHTATAKVLIGAGADVRSANSVSGG